MLSHPAEGCSPIQLTGIILGACLALSLVGIVVFFLQRRLKQLRKYLLSRGTPKGAATLHWTLAFLPTSSAPLPADPRPALLYLPCLCQQAGTLYSSGDPVFPLSHPRTSAAHSSVQVPEERQGSILRPEDHEKGDLMAQLPPTPSEASPQIYTSLGLGGHVGRGVQDRAHSLRDQGDGVSMSPGSGSGTMSNTPKWSFWHCAENSHFSPLSLCSGA